MTVELRTPAVDELSGVLGALRAWPQDGDPVQLHPGDLGWHWRFGAQSMAAAVRTWSRDGQVVAVGLVEPPVLRLAIAPSEQQDDELARQLAADVSQPGRGVLGEGTAYVEAPRGALVRDLLAGSGWEPDAAWTPLSRGLAEPVEDPGLRVEVAGSEQASVRAAVQRAAFDRSTFTEDRWRAMAEGPAYADARCLVAHDDRGAAVAAITVWSAGPGRPGLVEPMGVHRDHRGRGYGTAITLAGAAALRELGSSSAIVCTPRSNTGAVATYASAGFARLPDTRDLRRDPEATS